MCANRAAPVTVTGATKSCPPAGAEPVTVTDLPRPAHIDARPVHQSIQYDAVRVGMCDWYVSLGLFRRTMSRALYAISQGIAGY